MKKIVPDRVRKLREAKDWSQSQLAAEVARAGFGPLSYQAIQQLEEGTTKRPKYAIYLPAVLQTSWEYLTGETDNPATPGDTFLKDISTLSGSNGQAHPRQGVGQSVVREGPQVLAEMSHMLGLMEGRMEARAEARFTYVKDKLDDHEKRLEALEGRPLSGPRRGTRGR